VSAPRQLHLISADEALAQGYRPGGYLALCGDSIDAAALPGARCPDECDCEVTYCLGCLDAATERNWAAGVNVRCPPGITVVTGTRPGTRR